jgi:hypothetical protein
MGLVVSKSHDLTVYFCLCVYEVLWSLSVVAVGAESEVLLETLMHDTYFLLVQAPRRDKIRCYSTCCQGHNTGRVLKAANWWISWELKILDPFFPIKLNVEKNNSGGKHILRTFLKLRSTNPEVFLISGVGLWVMRQLTGLLYQPRMIGDDDCGEIDGMKIGKGNRSTRRKPAPLSTTNPTWLDPGLNPRRRGGKPATNRLSYGAALILKLLI